mmetsp:Transcript_20052/g.20754  ORF Transcript_20052/g.20754 Transcript_20052/m.20754 type:complete len:214 (+) Transcript_20052:56-697(+)
MWSTCHWRKGSGHEFKFYESKEEADKVYEKLSAVAKLLCYGRKVQKSSGCGKTLKAVKQYWEVNMQLDELTKSIEEHFIIQATSRWSVSYHWGRTGHHFSSYDSESEARKAYKKITPFATKILFFGREIIETSAPFCLFYLWELSVKQYSELCLSVMEHQDTLAHSLYNYPIELKQVNQWLEECSSPASPSSLVSSVESDTILGDSLPLVFYF